MRLSNYDKVLLFRNSEHWTVNWDELILRSVYFLNVSYLDIDTIKGMALELTNTLILLLFILISGCFWYEAGQSIYLDIGRVTLKKDWTPWIKLCTVLVRRLIYFLMESYSNQVSNTSMLRTQICHERLNTWLYIGIHIWMKIFTGWTLDAHYLW